MPKAFQRWLSTPRQLPAQTMQKVGSQIAKDAALLRDGRVRRVEWILAKGTRIAPKVLRELMKNGIQVYSVLE